MGVLVQTRKTYPDRLNVPVCSGRVVSFGPGEAKCVSKSEYRSRPEVFIQIGICDYEETVEKEYKQRDKTCVRCGGASKGMQCDFESADGQKQCIRCGVSVSDNRINFRTCSRQGVGDRVTAFLAWLGFKHCEACSRRRLWLNELDRKIYRWIWRKFHA